ncbi:MAG: hypothetical protein AB1490_16390 [Pseudomonadota bacterium]
MIRKFIFAVAATVALGAATLSVSSAPASAWGFKGFHHHHFHGGFWRGGYRFVGPVGLVGYNTCYAKRLVSTPWGLRWRWVNVCY